MRSRELIITTPDMTLEYTSPYLTCRDVNLQEKKIHASTIRSIQVLGPCIIHSTVFEMIYRYGIQVSCQHNREYPLSRIVPSSPYLDASVYKTQIRSADKEEMLKIAVSWLDLKVAGRIELLKLHLPESKQGMLTEYVLRWGTPRDDDELKSKAESRVEEAHSSRIYWKMYNYCLPHRFRFQKRTKHPGEDLTNVLLNYGYGILYSILERQLIKRGLDPSCGLFHVDGSGRKSLVYDLIESYRHHVEEIVLAFLNGENELLTAVAFNSTALDPEVKKAFVEYWKAHNQKHGVLRQTSKDIQRFKDHLESLDP